MRFKHSYAKAFRLILLNPFLWLFTTVNAQGGHVGYASFYHDSFHGKRTACGEKLDNNSYTCAHRSLPFGTKVEITNLKNGKFVVATVNDRGPYNYHRIVDVTKRVARDLDFQNQGTAKVKIRVLEINEKKPFELIDESFSDAHTETYGISLGTYDCKQKIIDLSRQVNDEFGVPVFVKKQKMEERVTYKVYAGSFIDKGNAEIVLNNLSDAFPNATVEAYIFAK